MNFSELIRSLQAAGAPVEAIAIAVEAIESSKREIDEVRRKAREKKRAQREIRRELAGTVPGQNRDKSGTERGQSPPSPPTPPLDAPFSLSPDPLPLSPLNPPVTPTINRRACKAKPGLNELSVDHLADWLAEKRSQGRYLDHDPHFILDQFKNYCQSKGKHYADFIAGYRNAFEWERCQPKSVTGSPTKADRAKAAVMRAAVSGGFAPQGGFQRPATAGDAAVP